MQLAVDVSNYQGAISEATFRAMALEGCRTVICGTDGTADNPLVFAEQVAAARAAGLAVEAYVFVYFSAPGDIVPRAGRKLDMIDAAGGIERVWIDCEDEVSPGLTPANRVGYIASVRDAIEARGYKPGIYTSRGWWERFVDNDGGFWDLPLWLAWYDGVRSLDLPTPVGPWTKLYRKQFTSGGTLGGVSPLDLNVEVDPPAPAPAPGGDARYTQADLDAAFNRGREEGRADMLGGVDRDLPELVRGFVDDWLRSRYSEWGVSR